MRRRVQSQPQQVCPVSIRYGHEEAPEIDQGGENTTGTWESSVESESNNPTLPQKLPCWWKSICQWTIFYLVVWLLWTLFSSSATSVAIGMRITAKLVLGWAIGTLISEIIKKVKNLLSLCCYPSPASISASRGAPSEVELRPLAATSTSRKLQTLRTRRSSSSPQPSYIGTIYALGLSTFILPTNRLSSVILAGMFHWVKPCRTLEHVMHQLQFESPPLMKSILIALLI
jgi:hypothetical protein